MPGQRLFGRRLFLPAVPRTLSHSGRTSSSPSALMRLCLTIRSLLLVLRGLPWSCLASNRPFMYQQLEACRVACFRVGLAWPWMTYSTRSLARIGLLMTSGWVLLMCWLSLSVQTAGARMETTRRVTGTRRPPTWSRSPLRRFLLRRSQQRFVVGATSPCADGSVGTSEHMSVRCGTWRSCACVCWRVLQSCVLVPCHASGTCGVRGGRCLTLGPTGAPQYTRWLGWRGAPVGFAGMGRTTRHGGSIQFGHGDGLAALRWAAVATGDGALFVCVETVIRAVCWWRSTGILWPSLGV